jgi:hypothetical protein
MAPSSHNSQAQYEWSQAKGLLPATSYCEKGPTGALVPDSRGEADHIAVVYDEGDAPPEITIKQVSGTVHTVLANGVAVAIVARTTGKAPRVSDVLLVERRIHS